VREDCDLVRDGESRPREVRGKLGIRQPIPHPAPRMEQARHGAAA
jgi:hypothetical protein